jgi:hypothetical protein
LNANLAILPFSVLKPSIQDINDLLELILSQIIWNTARAHTCFEQHIDSAIYA